MLMSVVKEFREFAMKGNVVDMAIGIIIGGAFGKIVTSLVNDVIMPPVGSILGGVDFSNLAFTIKDATENTGAVVLKYGMFINTIIDFTIVAGAIFFVIKMMNKMKKEEPVAEADPTHKVCQHCISEVPIKATKCKFCASSLS